MNKELAELYSDYLPLWSGDRACPTCWISHDRITRFLSKDVWDPLAGSPW